MAKRLATVIDSTMTMKSMYCQYSTMGPKTFISTVQSVKAAAPLEITDR